MAGGCPGKSHWRRAGAPHHSYAAPGLESYRLWKAGVARRRRRGPADPAVDGVMGDLQLLAAVHLGADARPGLLLGQAVPPDDAVELGLCGAVHHDDPVV